MLSKSTAAAAALLFRHGFPGRSRLVNLVANSNLLGKARSGDSLRWVTSRTHGLEIPCDLSVATGRIAYLLGRWYELATQSAILTLLPKGGTFVDIGANVGMATLTAARATGPDGRIVAFEPNPAPFTALRQAITRNQLRMVSAFNQAVGDVPGRLKMFVPDNNHGEASFGTAFGDREGKTIEVDVVDAKQLGELPRVDLIKVDVEGYEEHVLNAAAETLDAKRPIVITEIAAQHLSRCGSSAAAIDTLMERHAYSGFVLESEQVGRFRTRARLEPYRVDADEVECNVVWIPRERQRHVLSTKFAALPR
jgi:FkbM family methyltransferase